MAATKGRSLKSIALVAGATFAAKRALDVTWRLGARKHPPTDASDVSVPMREAMLWSVLSGATLGAVRTVAARKAAQPARSSASGSATAG